jgi:hypothetical protein
LESREAITQTKRDGLEVCVRMRRAVGYSHGKQKTDGRLLRLI